MLSEAVLGALVARHVGAAGDNWSGRTDLQDAGSVGDSQQGEIITELG